MESDVREVFTRASDFGTEAEYVFGDIARRIQVLFSENHDEIQGYGGEAVTTGPVAVASLVDVLNADDELPDTTATLEIDGTTYHVIKPIRAEGTCVMVLSRDPVN
jgi:hypothetical protein